MSLTFTLSGNSSVLSVNHFPAIDLNDDDYELGLANFETYHTMSNVNSLNNKFYFDKNDKKITIPEEMYELDAINEYLKRSLLYNVQNVSKIPTTMLLCMRKIFTMNIPLLFTPIYVKERNYRCVQNKL